MKMKLNGLMLLGMWGWTMACAEAVEIPRDPMCGSGFCDVASVSILGGPTDTLLDVDVVFPGLKHIALDPSGSPTTNVEFAINNTVNAADLNYRITMDVGDLAGNLLTSGALVHQAVAPANLTHIVNLPLTPLPAGLEFNNIQFLVETECAIPGACSTFDFLAAGGGGSVNTGASGPIRFNRAQSGFSIPEPRPSLVWGCVIGLLLQWRRRTA